MPIKKINVTFELDMNTFMQMLAVAPSNVRFEAYGTDVTRGTLPRVGRNAIEGGAKGLIMAHLRNARQGASRKDLQIIVMAQGYSTGTCSSQLHLLLERGLIRRKNNLYYVTAKGGANGQS